MTLFIFHHAGGSSYSYINFKESFPSSIEIEILELPGRGKKIRENLVNNIEEIAESLYLEIRDHLHKPYIFFGHSMGSLVAYLVIKKIFRGNLQLPLIFFTSASPAPPMIKNQGRFTLPSDRFWEMVKKIGGLPDEFFEADELKKVFEPILRSDFQALETYQHSDSIKMDVPIVIFIAEEDTISREACVMWQAETIHEVKLYQFKGNHFYLFENEKQVIDTILFELENAKTPRADLIVS